MLIKFGIKLCITFSIFSRAQLSAPVDAPVRHLKQLYHEMIETNNDMRDNLPILRTLSSRSTTVMELGVRSMVGSWAILLGLAENNNATKKIYISKLK